MFSPLPEPFGIPGAVYCEGQVGRYSDIYQRSPISETKCGTTDWYSKKDWGWGGGEGVIKQDYAKEVQ